MVVDSIKRGVVIDHIKAGRALDIYNYLDLDKTNCSVAIIKNAKSSTLGRKRIIMLAHDTVYETTICLEELIEQFPEYEFLPLNEGVEAIQF